MLKRKSPAKKSNVISFARIVIRKCFRSKGKYEDTTSPTKHIQIALMTAICTLLPKN